MSIKGWVYVISNKAMPSLFKIGFSLKDPVLRARELASTGSPHPYRVEYEVLLENPRVVEQRAHQHLADHREGKEWFRCTLDQAVSAIKAVMQTKVLIEKHYDPFEDAPIQGQALVANQSEISRKLNYRPVATYGGACSNCGAYFSTTLHPNDNQIKCPECFRQSDVTSFRRQEFTI